jgi:hypothetical protein
LFIQTEVINMIQGQTDVIGLTEEYRTLVRESGPLKAGAVEEVSRDQLVSALIDSAGWTAEGAAALVQVAGEYGSFMLRNALALAIALDIEDGDLGY